MLPAALGGVPGGMELAVILLVAVLQLGIPLALLVLAFLWLKRRTDTSDIENRLDDIEAKLDDVRAQLDERE